MYTIISTIRSVWKKFQLPKKFRDENIWTIVYVKNCAISQRANIITLYKEVNKFILSIADFNVLRYQYCIFVSNTTMH